MWHKPVGKSHHQGLLPRNASPSEDQVQCMTMPDEAWQAHRSAIGERHTPATTKHAKDRILGCHTQIAPESQLKATSDRISFNCSNHRFAQEHARYSQWCVAVFLHTRDTLTCSYSGKIGSGTKYSACSGECVYREAFIRVKCTESLGQFSSGGCVNGVAYFGSVDSDYEGSLFSFGKHSTHVSFLSVSRHCRLLRQGFV